MNHTVRGLTLAELLVVLAIIGVLSSLVVPAVTSVVRTATRTACAGNLRQVGMAALMYSNDFDGFLPAEGNAGILDPDRSPAWFFRLPSYVDRPDVRGRTVFQCAGWKFKGPHRFANASPKSFKWNSYLDDDGRPLHSRLGGTADASDLVLMIDGIAGETGAGQWGHCFKTTVDDSRHRGGVNVLHLDAHIGQVNTPKDKNWAKATALLWISQDWEQSRER